MRRRPVGQRAMRMTGVMEDQAVGAEAGDDVGAGVEAVVGAGITLPATPSTGATKITAGPVEIPPLRLYLYETTWPEVRAALPGLQVALIPTGSPEQHGIRRFLFVHRHGGNKPALNLVMNRPRHELGVRSAGASSTSVADDIIKLRVTPPITGHACECEMFQVLCLYPKAMEQDRVDKGMIREEIKAIYGKAPIEERRRSRKGADRGKALSEG